MRRRRLGALLSLGLVVPVGLGLKQYSGVGAELARYGLAGVAYEVFWCLALFLVRPRRRAIVPIVAAVLLATCGLELLQLWHPPPLERVRATWLGRALLGTTFDPRDFPFYAAGCGLGWAWLRLLCRLGEPDDAGQDRTAGRRL